MSIQFNGNYNLRGYTLRWAAWKSAQGLKGGAYQCDNDASKYSIWFYDGPEVHLVEIWRGLLPDGIIQSGYSQEQNDSDKADFESNYLPSANGTLEPRTKDGRLRTANEKPSSTRTNFYSHDFCDKTTWYSGAVRISDEVAQDSGDHQTYTLSRDFLIDSYHGKITAEDSMADAGGHSYRALVKVDGVLKVEQDPHFASGGDYLIDYEAGHVSFLAELSPNEEVKVTYHYATNSRFTVKPFPGKKLLLDLAEVQFSADINPKDSVIFEARGIADYFYPPAYVGNGPGQIPPGTVVSLQKFVYKAISDFHNDAFKSYPSYPAMGAKDNWRSQLQPVTVFDWDYLSATTLDSSRGMEIVVYLQHDTPYEGYMATATFYCKSESEV